MVEDLKSVKLEYEPFKQDEILRVNLMVVRNVLYISSEWPARVILWLSRRYHIVSFYSSMLGEDSFILTALIVCDKDYFRRWSHNPLLEYVRRIVK
nr:MAG TPA_asm: hypothetical protein [Microviridae sp.]